MKTFLVLSLLSNAAAFPIARRESTIRQEQHRLFSSPDKGTLDNASVVDGAQKSKSNSAGENPEALSDLLGEMFQAKLEISRETKELKSLMSEDRDMPVLGTNGIYRIANQRQLENFKAANADKLVFVKFSSPICAACRMLKQKFETLHRSPKFEGAPVVFADIVISNNKRVQDPFRDYITSELQVRRIPSIHFYGGGSTDQIFCDEDGGCSWPKIQQQMLDFVGNHSRAAATTKSSVKISKRKMIRRILSLSWLR